MKAVMLFLLIVTVVILIVLPKAEEIYDDIADQFTDDEDEDNYTE